MYLYMVSWWYIRKRLQKGPSSALCRGPKWREGRYFSPWQKIMSNIWVKNSKSETKVAMSVHDYVAASNKKNGSAAPLRNRGFVGWPQFQIINHFNSSNWLNLEDFLHILPWPKQYLTGEGWGWLVLQNGRIDPSHQKTTATRQTHAKKWKQQISPCPFKSANLWQPPTLHLIISSLAGSLDLIGLKPSDNATIQGYLVIHLERNSQLHRSNESRWIGSVCLGDAAWWFRVGLSWVFWIDTFALTKILGRSWLGARG